MFCSSRVFGDIFLKIIMVDRVGFEPHVTSSRCRIYSPMQSTALPSILLLVGRLGIEPSWRNYEFHELTNIRPTHQFIFNVLSFYQIKIYLSTPNALWVLPSEPNSSTTLKDGETPQTNNVFAILSSGFTTKSTSDVFFRATTHSPW